MGLFQLEQKHILIGVAIVIALVLAWFYFKDNKQSNLSKLPVFNLSGGSALLMDDEDDEVEKFQEIVNNNKYNNHGGKNITFDMDDDGDDEEEQTGGSSDEDDEEEQTGGSSDEDDDEDNQIGGGIILPYEDYNMIGGAARRAVKKSAGKKAAKKPAKKSAGKKPAGKKPAGKKPAGKKPTGEKPAIKKGFTTTSGTSGTTTTTDTKVDNTITKTSPTCPECVELCLGENENKVCYSKDKVNDMVGKVNVLENVEKVLKLNSMFSIYKFNYTTELLSKLLSDKTASIRRLNKETKILTDPISVLALDIKPDIKSQPSLPGSEEKYLNTNLVNIGTYYPTIRSHVPLQPEAGEGLHITVPAGRGCIWVQTRTNNINQFRSWVLSKKVDNTYKRVSVFGTMDSNSASKINYYPGPPEDSAAEPWRRSPKPFTGELIWVPIGIEVSNNSETYVLTPNYINGYGESAKGLVGGIGFSSNYYNHVNVPGFIVFNGGNGSENPNIQGVRRDYGAIKNVLVTEHRNYSHGRMYHNVDYNLGFPIIKSTKDKVVYIILNDSRNLPTKITCKLNATENAVLERRESNYNIVTRKIKDDLPNLQLVYYSAVVPAGKLPSDTGVVKLLVNAEFTEISLDKIPKDRKTGALTMSQAEATDRQSSWVHEIGTHDQM